MYQMWVNLFSWLPLLFSVEFSYSNFNIVIFLKYLLNFDSLTLFFNFFLSQPQNSGIFFFTFFEFRNSFTKIWLKNNIENQKNGMISQWIAWSVINYEFYWIFFNKIWVFNYMQDFFRIENCLLFLALFWK